MVLVPGMMCSGGVQSMELALALLRLRSGTKTKENIYYAFITSYVIGAYQLNELFHKNTHAQRESLIMSRQKSSDQNNHL